MTFELAAGCAAADGEQIMRMHSKRRWHRRARPPMLVALLVLGAGENVRGQFEPGFLERPEYPGPPEWGGMYDGRYLPSVEAPRSRNWSRHGSSHRPLRCSLPPRSSKASARKRLRKLAARCVGTRVKHAGHGTRHRAKSSTAPKRDAQARPTLPPSRP